jgi:hypothetical protein
LASGDAERAQRTFREAFDVKGAERDLHGACQARLGIALAALIAGRLQEASAEFQTSLREAVALGAQIFVIDALYGIGAVMAIDGDLVAAAKCCGLAAHLVEKTGCGPRAELEYGIAAERIHAGLSEEELAVAIAAGAAMKPEEAATLDRSSAAAS